MTEQHFLDRTTGEERISALATGYRENIAGIRDITQTREVNNHVHTRYSFSPYSPTEAVWYARLAGLAAVGSVDHESIGAARETAAAGRTIGMATTSGVEVRVSMTGTPFANRRLNNPDTEGNAYIVIHGVPEVAIREMEAFLKPLVTARRRRNEQQVARLNTLLERSKLPTLDYHREVEAISWVSQGGTVTERHILFALAQKITSTLAPGEDVVSVVEERLGVEIPELIGQRIRDEHNPHRLYDLLGVFKAALVDAFFIPPDDQECPPYEMVTAFARSIGAIPAYSYLGDVGESPTGDKKAQHFEDAYIDELFAWIGRMGFQAVTYMPPRNTPAQLQRVQRLCDEYQLLQISGVDINSSRQSFNCPEVLQPEFAHLNQTTWALIAHEKLSSRDKRYGLFHEDNPMKQHSLQERIAAYSAVGEAHDPKNPDAMRLP